MNYANIKYLDVANGPGVRTSLFVSGCRHHCHGCFNAEAQDFNYGEPFTKEVEDTIIDSLHTGLTILGGEPFEPENIRALAPFLERVKSCKPHVSIWVYSGFTFEQLMSRTGEDLAYTKRMLDMCDVLVDGKFVERLKSLQLQFRGSSNQRVIDIHETLESNVITEWSKLRR